MSSGWPPPESSRQEVLLQRLLSEALERITDKPWDDSTHLHKRISEALGRPVAYPDWPYEETYLAPTRDPEPYTD